MLFSERERTYEGPRLRSEPEYAYLDRSARPEMARIRDRLEEWFAHYPEARRAAFVPRFRSTDDAQFRSAFFELYVHETLRRLGHEVHVLKRPDFLVTGPDGRRAYVEATLASGVSHEERAAERLKAPIYDALRRMKLADFRLIIDEIDGAPKTAPRVRAFCKALRDWIAELDADAVAAAIEAGEEPPTRMYDLECWKFEIRARPVPEAKRGKPGSALAGEILGARMISTWGPIRSAILRKGGKYGKLDAPFIVAVNATDQFGLEDADVVEALFGQIAYYVTPGEPEVQPSRLPDGAWIDRSGPRYTRISGAILTDDLAPWTMAACGLRLYLNPDAAHPYEGPLCALPRMVVVEGRATWIDGLHPREILELPVGWPALQARPGV